MKFPGQGVQKVEPKQTDRQTDATENITFPLSRLVNIYTLNAVPPVLLYGLSQTTGPPLESQLLPTGTSCFSKFQFWPELS